MAFEAGALLARHFQQLKQLPRACGMVNALAHRREDLISR
jgi:hypothetical protein